jgi:hypothetical protein
MTSCGMLAGGEVHGRRLKSGIARKAPTTGNPTEGRTASGAPLAWAFVAQSHGIGIDYARKKYADVPIEPFGPKSLVR